jgi:hypothetical protein
MIVNYDRKTFIVQATTRFYIQIIIFFFYKTTYLNEEVNCTEPSRSVRIPWPVPPRRKITIMVNLVKDLKYLIIWWRLGNKHNCYFVQKDRPWAYTIKLFTAVIDSVPK